MVEVDPFRDDSFYHIEKLKCGTQVRKLLRQIDLFAQPITLRYKSEKMFYTNFGAATSIFIIVVMLILFVGELLVMLAKSKVTQSITSILTKNKDPTVAEAGGLFFFGYRFVD